MNFLIFYQHYVILKTIKCEYFVDLRKTNKSCEFI